MLDKIVDRIIRRFRPVDEILKFKSVFEGFQQILRGNNRALELISQLEDKMGGEYIFDINYLKASIDQLSDEIHRVVSALNLVSENHYTSLYTRQIALQEELKSIVEGRSIQTTDRYVLDYDQINADLHPVVGAKNAILGEIRERLEMPTPDGFAVTTAGYRRFLEYNNLWPQIRELYRAQDFAIEAGPKNYDDRIDELFAAAKFPRDLESAIERALGTLGKNSDCDHGFAVRSSAYGEDEEGKSYAGQFLSILHCPPDKVLSGYAKVIGSRFKYGSVAYDEVNALNESALPMSVAIQPMIPSRAAGVLYTVDVSGNDIDCMIVSATYGLGAGIVSGSMRGDYFRVSRLDSARVEEERIGNKELRLVENAKGGTQSVPVAHELQTRSCLSADDILELSEKALMLERYFKRALDIEWCFNEKNRLIILQCRPLMMPRRKTIDTADLRSFLAEKPILIRDQGIVAQRGIAAGKVSHVKEDVDPASFPVGAIAVTEFSSPRLAAILRRVSAIITDHGSSAGHLATVAREYGVPMIVDTKNATRLLQSGDEITVDAEENIVYRGIITELLEYGAKSQDVFRELEEYRILRRMLRKISPLNLVDPNDSNFTTQGCRTYHDIIRFCHEKAVRELIDLNISSRRFRGVKSKKVNLPIPLGLYVIDLGGGLDGNLDGDTIESVDQIHSVPMKAVLKGMTSPGIWNTKPMQFGLDDFMSSITRYSLMNGANEYQGQNLAVVSECYCNINLRLGYHFNVIDTYVSGNTDDNYTYFRFVGGVTESERRQLRAVLLKRILERMDFKVAVSGDLVIARLKRLEASGMVAMLETLGRLIGFSRQLDTQMQSDESVNQYFNAFYELET
jgi:pyruvate,water dikinase